MMPKVKFSANFFLPVTKGGMSHYLAPAKLVGSHTIKLALSVMKNAYSYTTMVLKMTNKMPV